MGISGGALIDRVSVRADASLQKSNDLVGATRRPLHARVGRQPGGWLLNTALFLEAMLPSRERCGGLLPIVLALLLHETSDQLPNTVSTSVPVLNVRRFEMAGPPIRCPSGLSSRAIRDCPVSRSLFRSYVPNHHHTAGDTTLLILGLSAWQLFSLDYGYLCN